MCRNGRAHLRSGKHISVDRAGKLQFVNRSFDKAVRELWGAKAGGNPTGAQHLHPYEDSGRLELARFRINGLEIARNPFFLIEEDPKQPSERPRFLLDVHLKAGRQADISELRRVFDLTGVEAALAHELYQGGSIQSHADHRGTSIHTARDQLKSIFTKTGARRQSQVVAMVAKFAQ